MYKNASKNNQIFKEKTGIDASRLLKPESKHITRVDVVPFREPQPLREGSVFYSKILRRDVLKASQAAGMLSLDSIQWVLDECNSKHLRELLRKLELLRILQSTLNRFKRVDALNANTLDTSGFLNDVYTESQSKRLAVSYVLKSNGYKVRFISDADVEASLDYVDLALRRKARFHLDEFARYFKATK